jgi:hypothetical protein
MHPASYTVPTAEFALGREVQDISGGTYRTEFVTQTNLASEGSGCDSLEVFGSSVNRNSIFLNVFILQFHTHYMFRPLRAIFRWNCQFLGALFATTGPFFFPYVP